jgi:multidrug efflux pump subunit AcrB
MNGLIRASLRNPHAVIVMSLTLLVLGGLSTTMIKVDILPVFNSPAVQALTFYGGMPAASVEKDITNRMERWTGQASGIKRQESRSIVGASIIRNYFQGDVDPNGALTQVNSLALAVVPNMPPGTLPPVVLPFDPTSTVPVSIVALNSQAGGPTGRGWGESILYDVARYEVRNMIMGIPGAVAPVVFGGKLRAVMIYLDRTKLQARGLSPLDVMNAVEDFNLFMPTGDAKFGETDYALESNAMFDFVKRMGDAPLRTKHGNSAYVRDVATPKDAALIQTNIVRVNGRRQVYIPVFRQLGASTLSVVNAIKDQLSDMEARLTRSNINLKLVMDQSVYVRKSIESLVQEGVLGAVLCSLVILLFLGQWRMTAIAIMTLPISVMAAIACLYFAGQTINVMTLAGLTLAIGPMIDSAIICLENTHRHLDMGATPNEAAFLGASEVAMPELVSTLCTFLVLAPLVLTPGIGRFLFQPLAMAVAFAMICAYVLSRTLVPTCSAYWLKPHQAHAAHDAEVVGNHDPNAGGETFRINGNAHAPKRRNPIARAFDAIGRGIDRGIALYVRGLDGVLRHRVLTVAVAFSLLAVTLIGLWPHMRREFFPEVDAGAFEMYVRAPSGTRIENTEARVKAVEEFLEATIDRASMPRDAFEKKRKWHEASRVAEAKGLPAPAEPEFGLEEESDLQLFISEIGVTPDWSAAYTPNAGPMDTVIKVQLGAERKHSAQEYVDRLRAELAANKHFSDLEFAFDAGGMIRGAMNEGKSTPINIRVTGKDRKIAHGIAVAIKNEVTKIKGVVDARVIQRLDYPEYKINVNRAKAADLGLNERDVMRNVVAACNSSIQFNKKNFWIDPVSHNQYFVGVSYPEQDIKSIETLLDIPLTSPKQDHPIPLRNVASIERTTVPTEVKHYNIQPTIELTMGVSGRDLGHVSDEVQALLARFGKDLGDSTWAPYELNSQSKSPLRGYKIVLSGEYARMRDTFSSLAIGLTLASLLIYFLMVALDKSFLVPLTVMLVVPLCLAGILPMLYLTGSAVNVQSLLGFIFIVGIKVANTVLMTDYAQELRHHEGLTPTEAIRKAASLRVRPVTMTALAAFFAMIPAAMALEQGSEANAPLARAILGGLLAGEPATLFVLPALYSLIIRDSKSRAARNAARHVSDPDAEVDPTPDAGWV